MIVCTADRPPSLWDVGAPQVIDQTHLFGAAVRFFAEPGVPHEDASPTWRSLASRTYAEAAGWSGQPGPVHLNLSFADPLTGQPGVLPPGRSSGQPWHTAAPASGGVPGADSDIGSLAQRMVGRMGVIVAGRGTSDPSAVIELAARLGWPVLADHRSGCRRPGVAIDHFDALLRSERFAAAHVPQVVLRFGQILASKVLSQWMAASAANGADVIVAAAARTWNDPERLASTVVAEAGLAMALLDRVPAGARPVPEAALWQQADEAAAKAIQATIDQSAELTDPEVARAVTAGIERSEALVLSSSMPVRDVEWYAAGRANIAVYANRGANGIDGVVSTAIGVALTGAPTTVLIGDVAMVHDSTALIALAARQIDLTIVVVDNDGGGIFSFLPQQDLLPDDRFERLFGTPHGTNIATLAKAHGIDVVEWDTDLRPKGVRMVIASTDRSRNVAFHDELHDAVRKEVDRCL